MQYSQNAPHPDRIRIGIADDHVIVRRGLAEFLAAQPDMAVVGEASDGRAVVDLVRTVPMNVLVLDIGMPSASGVDSLASIRLKAPKLGLLIFTGFPAESYGLKALKLGAAGYLNKQCDPPEILDAIRAIAKGRRYVQADLADLLARTMETANPSAPHTRLTPKHFQVFVRLARGQRTEEIADELFISQKTVSTYKVSILKTLGASSNSDLTKYALRHNLIE